MSVNITVHTQADGTKSITVTEALQTELISADVFESARTDWLQSWEIQEHKDGTASGFFRVTAYNGNWTYRLTRHCWWLGQKTFEAELVEGEVLLDSVWSTGSGPGGAAPGISSSP